MRTALLMLPIGLLILTAVVAQQSQSGLYVAIYGRGPNWVEGTRVDRQPGIEEHTGYMVKLFREKQLKQGGPFLDDSGGLIVFVAADGDEARAVVSADPGIKSGVFKLDSLRPWSPVDWGRMSTISTQIAEAKCEEYYNSAKFWRVIKKQYPRTLSEMEVPLRPGEVPYLRVENDPWGNPYVLVAEGRTIRVHSRGPDGKEGTADDITYPAER